MNTFDSICFYSYLLLRMMINFTKSSIIIPEIYSTSLMLVKGSGIYKWSEILVLNKSSSILQALEFIDFFLHFCWALHNDHFGICRSVCPVNFWKIWKFSLIHYFSSEIYHAKQSWLICNQSHRVKKLWRTHAGLDMMAVVIFI